MKKKHFLIIFLLFAVSVWLLWNNKRQMDRAKIPPSTNEINKPEEKARKQAAKITLKTNADTDSSSNSNFATIGRKRAKQMDEARETSQNEWRTPINFYGKVVDEKEQPIVDAKIHLEWNDLSAKGTSDAQTHSDVQGLFSLIGKTGKGLSLTITKEGYYTPEESRYASYEYGDPYAHFTPDARNPIIFHLKRKDTAEPLIHLHAALGGEKGFRISKDGTPVAISLTTGNSVSPGQGDLQVACWTDDTGKAHGQKYDWKCTITVPGGGIQQYTNEFPFQAPLEGYQSSDEIDMPANKEKGWGRNAKRNYFLKLPNGNYARVSFAMIAGGDHFFKIESFLNPSGSRNLEFDPQMAITP